MNPEYRAALDALAIDSSSRWPKPAPTMAEARIIAQRIERRHKAEANSIRAWAAALFTNSDGEAKAATRRSRRRAQALCARLRAKATAAAYFDRCTAAGIAPSLAGQFRSNRDANPAPRQWFATLRNVGHEL